jgi:nicotinic acid mononucleotide adenylyltransferase
MLKYLSSPLSKLGYSFGIFLYIAFSFVKGEMWDLNLLIVSLLLGMILPYYDKLAKEIQDRVNLSIAVVSIGNLSRVFLYALFFTFFVRTLSLIDFFAKDVLSLSGGLFGYPFVWSLSFLGFRYFANALASRNIGKENTNMFFANTCSVGCAALLISNNASLAIVALAVSIIIGSVFLSIGILSDIRRFVAPKGGIGIFVGTFNPFHNTHFDIIKAFMKDRNLEKVYIHSTAIPKLHNDALLNDEIEILHREMGMRVYKKTSKADPHKNYFPTGNKFYEYDTRLEFIRLALKEGGLENSVEILDYRNDYDQDGFYGVIKRLKNTYPNKRIHAVHGSDSAGMWIRRIYDESGWLYPYPVLRVNTISATAIRNGASGMAPDIIENALKFLRKEIFDFDTNGYNFQMSEGILKVRKIEHSNM